MSNHREKILWDGGGYRVTSNGDYPPVAWQAVKDDFGNIYYQQVTQGLNIAYVFGRCIRDLTERKDKPYNDDAATRPGASVSVANVPQTDSNPSEPAPGLSKEDV